MKLHIAACIIALRSDPSLGQLGISLSRNAPPSRSLSIQGRWNPKTFLKNDFMKENVMVNGKMQVKFFEFYRVYVIPLDPLSSTKPLSETNEANMITLALNGI
jgi:hypothetical protein